MVESNACLSSLEATVRAMLLIGGPRVTIADYLLQRIVCCNVAANNLLLSYITEIIIGQLLKNLNRLAIVGIDNLTEIVNGVSNGVSGIIIWNSASHDDLKT